MPNEFLDQIWKVCEGSGMGLLHSGDVADLAYYNRADRGWAACPVIMGAYGIVKIWRSRDDVLLLASERLKSLAYGPGVINRAGHFIAKCEKISHDTFEYLDCEVWIEKTAPSNPGLFIKPTNLRVPLRDTRCHPVHIHESWPVCAVRRLGDLNTSHSDAVKAKDLLIEWFVRHLASPDHINRLRSTLTGQTKTSTKTKREVKTGCHTLQK